MTPYTEQIKKLAPNHDPDQVECFMRLEYGTLDRLPAEQFASEVRLACMCIDEDPEMARKLAASYGFQ